MADVILSQVNWMSSEGVNECYAFWKWEPCCGPGHCQDIKQAGKCLLCWGCTPYCSFAKLHAASMDEQPCALWPHGILLGIVAYMVPVAGMTCVRFNLRQKRSIPAGGPMDGLIGDCLCSVCCGSFAFCQHLRAAEKDDWDWIITSNPVGKADFAPAFFRGGQLFPQMKGAAVAPAVATMKK